MKNLLPFVAVAMCTAAPERAEAVRALLDGLTIEIIDDPRVICNADLARRMLRISTRMIEALWCYSYAAWVFYTNEAAGKIPSGSMETISNPETLAATKLLRWSIVDWLECRQSSWPADVPQPGPGSAPTSENHRVAHELCLMACGFLLLHELAHLALRHSPEDNLLDQERDADNWVSDWILGQPESDEDQFQKRTIGVSIALLSIVAYGIHTGWWDGKKHPRHFDRLTGVLERYVPPESAAWAFVAALLSLHVTNSGLEAARPRREFSSWHEAVSAYIDCLSEAAAAAD